mgnify:CR=1 FL=1
MVYAIEIGPTNFIPSKIADIGTLLNILLPLLMIGGAAILFVMLMIGGFRWLTAGDNPESVKQAQQTLTYAVFGLLVVFLSYLGVKLLAVILNINIPI